MKVVRPSRLALLVPAHRVHDHYDGPYRYGRIGDIEGRPVSALAAGQRLGREQLGALVGDVIDVDEIDDVAEQNAVDDIATRHAQDQSERATLLFIRRIESS